MNFLHPGQGTPLYVVTASTGNVKVLPNETAIETTQYSESVSGSDAMELMFVGTLNGGAAGNIVVERSGTYDFANFHDHETITMPAASRSFSWRSGGMLGGFFRLKNSTGARLIAFCQKRIN